MARARKPRFGILTGGGDCPGLNAVIRAVVRAATHEHPATIVGIEDGYEGLILPGKAREIGPEDVRGILPRGGTILGASNRANPFAHPDRHGRKHDRSRAVLQRIGALRLDGLLVVGGEGTLHMAHRLAEMGVAIVAVPKTIDNDLRATEVTFGFDTAVQTAMWGIDKLFTTAESHDRVMILEVMGRTAGWIALHAGLAGGVHAILLPEIPYDPDTIARLIRARQRRGRNYTVVVVSEGAAALGEGEPVVGKDALGFKRYGGAGERLRQLLGQRVEHEVRVTVLGHLQRGGSPSAADRILASRFGAAALALAAEGRFGKMVALRAGRIVAVPLAEAAGGARRVDPQGELCRTARAMGISFGERPT